MGVAALCIDVLTEGCCQILDTVIFCTCTRKRLFISRRKAVTRRLWSCYSTVAATLKPKLYVHVCHRVHSCESEGQQCAGRQGQSILTDHAQRANGNTLCAAPWGWRRIMGGAVAGAVWADARTWRLGVRLCMYWWRRSVLGTTLVALLVRLASLRATPRRNAAAAAARTAAGAGNARRPFGSL